MAPLIVDLLKVVDIHANQRHRLFVQPLTLGQALLKHHVEAAGIRQFGERIGKRAFFRSLKSKRVVER